MYFGLLPIVKLKCLVLGVELYKVFINLHINPLSDVSLMNMFSNSEGCFLILLMISFSIQKLFSLMCPICLFFTLFILHKDIYQKEILLRKVSDILPPMIFSRSFISLQHYFCNSQDTEATQ